MQRMENVQNAKLQRRLQREDERRERELVRLRRRGKEIKAAKERRLELAAQKLAAARKHGRSAIVNFGNDGEDGELKLTMLVQPPKPKKPPAPSSQSASGYAAYGLTCQQLEHLDKYGIETPVEQADPYTRVTLNLKPVSNGK